MKKILFILFLWPVFLPAQTPVTITGDTTARTPERHAPHDTFKTLALKLSNGRILTDTSTIKLGKGSLPNGDYNFIATASNTMEAKLKKSTTLTEIKLIDIKKKGNKKYGYTYTIYCEGGYHLQLENAVLASEIIL